MEYIKQNLDYINKRIKAACDKSGRNYDDIILCAVTKTIESDIINESINNGVYTVGENRVQEITRKYPDIKSGVKWHYLIGHLQTNKVKYIIDKVDLIHSVDSFKLAVEIDKKAKSCEKIMEVLIQVNVADEDSKFGISPEELNPLLAELEDLDNIKVVGLMTIAPFEDDPEDVRVHFKCLKKLFDEVKNTEYSKVEMKYLSMGMTNDFEVAIEEGANIVRIGTGIYGKRNYT